MSGYLETASGVARAEGCPISFSLPQVLSTSEDAESGTAKHDFLRRVLGGEAAETALEHVPVDDRDTCRGIQLPELLKDFRTVRSETAYAYNVRTGVARELGRNIGRRYEGILEDEIPGTFDVEGVGVSGLDILADAKFGHGNVTPTADNRQIHVGALVRRAMTGADEIEGRLWRFREDGFAYVEAHLFDAYELDTIAEEVLEIHEGVVRARDALQKRDAILVRPGDYCRYCPASPTCPATVARAKALGSGELIPVASLSKLTKEEAWRAVMAYREAKPLLEAIGERLKLLAAQEPIRSPDGMLEYRASSTTKANFSKELALELLRELGADEDQIRSLYIPFTHDSYRVLKVKGAKKPKAPKTLGPVVIDNPKDEIGSFERNP